MDVLDGLIRHQQSVLILEIAGGMSRSFDHVLQQGEVIRIYSAGDPLEGHWERLVKFKNAIELLRPCDFVCRYTPRKGSGSAQTLAFGKEGLTETQFFNQLLKLLLGSLELHLRPLSIVDVGICPIPFEDLARFIGHGIGTKQKPSILAVKTA